MRLYACAAVAVFMLAATAQTPKLATVKERMAELQRMEDIRRRAYELRPRRRDIPMRELNITDGEIREIQAIAVQSRLSAMLNISPVVAGCACEEGPLCTDQVYVVAETPAQTVGLQLSRVRNAWVVGAVQRWWNRYDALRANFKTMDFRTYEQAENELLLEFPMCVGKDEPAATATAQSRETTK
jgi:hypothetical protein